ncbi:MAG: PAS domain-containing protein [Nitrospiraceae bacterium]|nr:MAG: PAS domain-containing protein [Nitrospiraceae bacterium]
MERNSPQRILAAGAFIVLGAVAGIMAVPVLDGGGTSYLAAAGAAMVVAFIISKARRHWSRAEASSAPPSGSAGGSQVGFIVDTFHGLVAKLKEKEAELETLKSCAEEKAMRMEAYNENILQSVPSGVITVDHDMRIRSVNQAAERILEISAAKGLDRNLRDVLGESLASHVAAQKALVRSECPYVTGSGRHSWLGITVSQLKNAENRILGQILVFTDLTDIKALQGQLELKQRLSQLGEMSAGIAHELRNSMSVISGYARLMEKHMNVSGASTVSAIQAEIGTMDTIISELLAFARPTELNRITVNLYDLLEETLTSLKGQDTACTVSLRGINTLSVKADRLLLRQAFANLVKNAFEAMPNGGSLRIDLMQRHDRPEIRVRDSGCGIPPELHQKIFLPFFSTKEKGTGFGLALVQKIILSHGGSIEVHSREGEGTEFVIVLPGGE